MRKTARLLLGTILLVALAVAADREPWEVFAGRRARLLEKLSDGVVVLFGYTADEGETLRNPFRQENNFYYLTGWNEPGAILMLTPPMKERNSPVFDQVNQMPRQILFLPGRDPKQERWTGIKIGPYDEGLRDKTGFEAVRGVELFEKELSKAGAGFGRIYTIKPRPRAADRDPEPERAASLEKLAPLTEIADARPAITAMRMVKSPGEVGLIQKATDTTIAAHLAAWKRVKPGLFEYQIAAAMESVFLERGCWRPAYAPIVGGGFNSTVLHYSENSRRMDDGQVLLMDVGGEYGHYATDITRTIPVNGKFTPRQREIYEIVLGAQKAALAAAKPGMSLRTGPNSLHQIAYNYINAHGKDREGNPLGKYFIHGLGHHVGLDVHDPSSPETLLQPGMVITLEPGIYMPEEQLGVRIEDLVLVTEDGAKLLSGALPREPDEVERAMH
ncbi:MAG: aminopeptidase P family protein [Acidobacteria bacterium]|nr:aminopeptidase P family protein [Acidobacteriota bacterium]